MNDIIEQIVRKVLHEEFAELKAALLEGKEVKFAELKAALLEGKEVKREPTDIEGKAAIAKYLGCSEDYVTWLWKCHLLGRLLWKNNGSRNSKLRLCKAPLAKKRCDYIRTCPPNELSGWIGLDADVAEAEFTRIKL